MLKWHIPEVPGKVDREDKWTLPLLLAVSMVETQGTAMNVGLWMAKNKNNEKNETDNHESEIFGVELRGLMTVCRDRTQKIIKY